MFGAPRLLTSTSVSRLANCSRANSLCDWKKWSVLHRVRYLSSTTTPNTSAAVSPRMSQKGRSNRMGKKITYGALGGVALVAAGVFSYMHEELGGLHGIYRSISFYSVAVPRYIEYRLLMLGSSDDLEQWYVRHALKLVI